MILITGGSGYLGGRLAKHLSHSLKEKVILSIRKRSDSLEESLPNCDFRIFDIAIVDVILTLVLARILQKKVLKNCDYPYFVYVYGTFALGIFMHRFFCVRTTIDKLLFSS